MRTTLSMVVAGLAALSNLSASAAVARAGSGGTALEYVFSPSSYSGRAAVRVALRFRGEPSGRTVLVLPSQSGSQRELWKGISDLEVSGGGARIVSAPSNNQRVVAHRPNAVLQVVWTLHQVWAGDMPEAGRNETYHAPTVLPDYVLASVYSALLRPSAIDLAAPGLSAQRCSVRLRWRAFPADWRFITHGASGQDQSSGPAPCSEFLNSYLAFGRFRELRSSGAGERLSLAVRGRWLFSDEEFLARLAGVHRAAAAAFDDPGPTSYLVALVPARAEPGSSTRIGSGSANGFVIQATENSRLDDFGTIMFHEYVHSWLPGLVGDVPDEQQANLNWFREGFTEYYEHLLPVRVGVADVSTYVASINALLREYFASPVRTASNDETVRGFWSDPRLARLVYVRGALLALNWNAEISKSSRGRRSVDDVVASLIREYRTGRSPPLSAERIVRAALAAGAVARPSYDRYIVHGGLLSVNPDALGSCAEFRATSPRYDHGYDGEAVGRDPKRTIRGVVTGSAAWKAGLRNGQHHVRTIKGAFGDPNEERVIIVREDGSDAEKEIRYYPAGEFVDVPRFVVRDGAASNATCRRFLGIGRDP